MVFVSFESDCSLEFDPSSVALAFKFALKTAPNIIAPATLENKNVFFLFKVNLLPFEWGYFS